MTTLDIIYTILYCYGAIATIWAATMLFMLWLAGDEVHISIRVFVLSTILWPYTMYLSLKATLFEKSKPAEE